MLEEELCTRTCIEELQVATLELLMGTFREGGAVPFCPPSPINLCPNPPPGRLPCAAPWGQILFVLAGDGAFFPPPPLPSPRPPAPQTTGPGEGGRGGSATIFEGAIGPAHQRWERRGPAGSQSRRPLRELWGPGGFRF